MNVHVFGEKSGASIFPPQIYSENVNSLTDTQLSYLRDVDKHYESITDFVLSSLGEKEPVCRGEEALMIQKIIDSMYRSSETGQPIKL